MANIAVATRIHAAFPSAAVLRRHEPPTPEMFEPLMQVRWRLARVRLMVKRALCEGCKWRSVAVVCFSAAVWALLACNCRLACVPARPLPSPEQLASTHGTQNAAPLQHICFALGCSTLTTSSHEQIARARGIKLDAASSKQLAESLDAAKSIKDPYFNKLLRILATRCMTQAKYFSSGELAPAQFVHYGLAVPIYTHFTSPIRRCADCSTVALVADANAAQSAQAAEHREVDMLGTLRTAAAPTAHGHASSAGITPDYASQLCCAAMRQPHSAMHPGCATAQAAAMHPCLRTSAWSPSVGPADAPLAAQVCRRAGTPLPRRRAGPHAAARSAAGSAAHGGGR